MLSRRSFLGSLVGLVSVFWFIKPKPKQLVLPDGTKIFFLKRDEFKVEHPDGKEEWANSKGYHRVEGPARICTNSDGGQFEEWFLNGVKHREGGPAYTYVAPKRPDHADVRSNRKWYRHGKYHREDGPALEYDGLCEYWYRDGELHRENGPAIIQSSGVQGWYKNGIFIKGT